MKFLLIALLTIFSSGLVAVESKALPKGATATAKEMLKAGSFESEGVVYAVGESIRVVAKREKAELQALKDAAARMAELLSKKGLGKKKEIAKGVENSVLMETELSTYQLGKVVIDNVYQERWDAPDGKEAWSVRVMISIRRK